MRPSGMPPAAFMRSTTGASSFDTSALFSVDPVGVRLAGLIEVVLDGEGHAVKRPQLGAALDRGVGGLGRGPRLVGEHDRHGVDLGVHRADPRQVRLDDLERAHLPLRDRLGELARAGAPELARQRRRIRRGGAAVAAKAGDRSAPSAAAAAKVAAKLSSSSRRFQGWREGRRSERDGRLVMTFPSSWTAAVPRLGSEAA